MEYMYIITLNDRKCQNASKCLLRIEIETSTKMYTLFLNRIELMTYGPYAHKWHRKEENFFTHHFKSLKCIRFSLSRTILFCHKQWGRGMQNFRLSPLLGPKGILTGQNWHNSQLDHVFYKRRP